MSQQLISCLCVTENRHEFIPWLLWNYEKQDWRNKELVIVDSSSIPISVAGRSDVRLIGTEPHTSIGAKRNICMKEARGEIFTWFDDDDWQHPEKLTRIYKPISEGAVIAGNALGWFVDLKTLRCRRYNGTVEILFNSAGFLREEVIRVQFNERMRRHSSTPWLLAVLRIAGGRHRIVNSEPLFFWLSHDNNLSNPSRGRHFGYNLEVFGSTISIDVWKETLEALEQLRTRLRTSTG